MNIARASVAERLESDLDFARREYNVKMSANAELAAALDKAGKDYQNQLKESQNKTGEINAAYEAKQAELRARATVEQNNIDVANLEAGERAKIAATSEGSQERLSVITAAMAKAQNAAMQDTDFYRTLATERAAVMRQMAAEEAKAAADAGKEAAENELKTGQLELAAQEQSWNLQASARRVREAEAEEHEKQIADAEFALKLAGNLHEQAALDASGKEYENKLKTLQDKETQLIREHENQKTQIKEQAEIQRNTRILAAEQSQNNAIAASLTATLMGHRTFAATMTSLGDQVASGMMENAIKSVLANDFTKESDAAKAARKAFNIGLDIGGPAGFVLGPVMGAMAFASVMAFNSGTDMVPGTGRGDVVPAMLTPGEGVVPGGVMDGLRTMAKSGGFDKQPSMTIHPTFAPTIHALDKDGVSEVLDKHAKQFHQHFEKVLRKMNK